MTEDREKGKENWSDFEATIDEMVKNSPKDIEKIESCNIHFPSCTNHYDLYYYVFFNFNYTSLLDNYLYLDKKQFDPHKWKKADRNFNFYPDNIGTNWSSHLVSDIIHPHGFQDIPRSILFGIDLSEYDRGRAKERRLVKSHWAQYNVKYKSYFDNVELFIIFGMAISQTDGWWFDQIFDSILENNSELIIYKYGTETEENIKNTFINAYDIWILQRRILIK